jgi:membrane protein required for colicin V production
MIASITFFDVLLIFTLIASSITGIYRGFLSELVSLFSWVIAFWAAFNLDLYLFGYFFSFVSSEILQLWLTRLLIMLAVLISGSFVNKILNSYLKLKITGNLILGLSFGLLRGLIFIALIILVIEDTPFYNDSWIQDSILIGYAEIVSDLFLNFLLTQNVL